MVSLLSASFLHADLKEKGFFVGIDFGADQATVDYKQSGTATNAHSNTTSTTKVSPKIGYQYYFTRIALTTNKMNYEDYKSRYTIQEEHIACNIDYLPLLYKDSKKDIGLKGIAGISLGYSRNTLSSIRQLDQLLPVSPQSPYNYTQENFDYGYQLGVMLTGKDGLNFELGFKSRIGTLLEFQDDTSGSNRATFSLDSQEWYLGFNYLF